MLSRSFARAVGEFLPCAAPSMAGKSAAEALQEFRAFTNRAARAACDLPEAERATVMRRLGRSARRLGVTSRLCLFATKADAFAIMRYLYAAIGIEIEGELPGELRFCRCFFAHEYTPAACLLMSAMDEGVMAGLVGEGSLEFSHRITEGCSCCTARFTLDRSDVRPSPAADAARTLKGE